MLQTPALIDARGYDLLTNASQVRCMEHANLNSVKAELRYEWS